METIDINDLPFEEYIDENESGSIINFFKTCKLNVQFQDPYFHENMTELFSHFHSRYPVEHTIEDVIEELKSSYKYETTNDMNPEIYTAMMNEENDIIKLHHILEPKVLTSRNKKVHINDGMGTKFTGAKQSFVDIKRLQQWVDVFHSYEFNSLMDKTLCGFILYLMYVRIHPHSDGNGRMARYLFLENKLLLHNLCPLSKILNDDLKIVDNHMEKVFDWLDDTINVDKATAEDYYKLYIPLKIEKEIYYIIYMATCYKYCCKVCNNFRNVLMKSADYCSIFCLCKGCHEVGTSTAVKISHAHGLNNQRFAGWLNDKFFNFEQHKQIICDICSVNM